MITAILNCYRRPQNLQAQIKAIMDQSVPPSQIWVWKNYHPDQNSFDWESFSIFANQSGIRIIESNYNWKYCGRFAAACLVDTEYTAIFDDDTIPGSRWFENCLQENEKQKGIYGGIGICLDTEVSYEPHVRHGWASQNKETVEVDLVGHAWFFPAEYIKYMWLEKPMWENGEDIHFSAMAQIHGGVKTYVPPHPKDKRYLWSSLYGMELGVDEVASSAVKNHKKFYKERDECIQRLVGLGWKTYVNRKT